MSANSITRQIFPFANEIDCTDTFKNLFQFDIDNNKSWNQMVLAPVFFIPPAVFAPQQIGYSKHPRLWFSSCRNLDCKSDESF